MGDPDIKQKIFDGLILFVLETVSSTVFLKNLNIYRPEPLNFDYKDPEPTLPYDSARQPRTLSDLITQVIDNTAKPGIYPLSTVLYSTQAGASEDLGSSVHYVAIRPANPENPLEANISGDQLVIANGYKSKLLDNTYITKLNKQLKKARVSLARERESGEAENKMEHIKTIYDKWEAEKKRYPKLDRFIGLGVQKTGGDGICQTVALMFYLDDYNSLKTNVSGRMNFKENERSGFTFLKNLIEEDQDLELVWNFDSLIKGMTKPLKMTQKKLVQIFANLGLVANDVGYYTLSNIITSILNPSNDKFFESWSFGSPLARSECRRTGIDTRGRKRQYIEEIDDQLIEGVDSSSCLII